MEKISSLLEAIRLRMRPVVIAAVAAKRVMDARAAEIGKPLAEIMRQVNE